MRLFFQNIVWRWQEARQRRQTDGDITVQIRRAWRVR